MDIDVRIKTYEKILSIDFTPNSFKEHWEKNLMSGNFVYNNGLHKAFILNFLLLNKEVETLRAELQELKPAKTCNSDPFLLLLSLWITSHPGHEVSTRDLYNDLKAISEDKGLSFTLPDARALGVKLKQFEQELKERYSLTSRTGAGNVRFYSFKEVASIIGWSEEKVKQYSALKAICKEAWNLIVTTFEDMVTKDNEEEVTEKVTTVTITERLLRSILPLRPIQQTELVKDLISGSITKGRFKNLPD